MAPKKLHPNVVKFKEFVKQYPKISIEVKKGAVTWQELYEDWYLLGEEDPRWEQFKGEKVKQVADNDTEEKKSDLMSQVMDYIKTMDINQMQQHINHVSQALGAVQGVLSQFQTPTKPNIRNQSGPSHPFTFRKD
jgi:hypothetical protein